jgi:cytochrome bd-type quinol oxidase subunit 1
MADLDLQFAATEQVVQAGQQALNDYATRQRADDRSFIAKLIIWSFVATMAVVVIAVSIGTWLLTWEKISEPAKYLMTILSSVLLPVVTLVLGYYFGKENK